MAGLLLKELKYRGLTEKVLIIVPGHLKDQWLREMKERFQENFEIIDRNVMYATWGQNAFTLKNQVIVSMDFAKQDDVLLALKDTHWDLCIFDEAHKMSAYKYGSKINKAQRYVLGELLSPITNSVLFLTATPHRGDPENFRLLLDLLEPGFFANTEMLSESIQNKDNPLFIRRLKEDLKDFDGAPIFPPRTVETLKFRLSEDEKRLYNAVTDYVEKHFNKALQKEKRNVTFALTILQRRLASSARAIKKSLERRFDRLQDLYKKGELLMDQRLDYDEDYLEDLEERERLEKEEELLQKLTSSETLPELKDEIDKLEGLVAIAREVEKKEVETKLNELRKLLDSRNLKDSDTKLLIFTESRDTLEYLIEKLKRWGYSVTCIHGGMNLDKRIKAEHEFKNEAQIMVSTEAGGEGINLQFCWLMVNYDIPWNPNRLEQRMGRVHRYGQRNEVFIYNMVAIDTREGRILNTLFDKLARIRENMGSDRVFDVVGEIKGSKSLKDLILDAISNRRTMEEILQDIERIPDEEAINNVRQANLEALATRHIDFSRVLGEQRTAKENRLVPEYVEEFFTRAAKELSFKMDRRPDGLWNISSVPMVIRDQSYSFKAKYGEIGKEYSKVSFDKNKAFESQAEFMATGHPFFEAVVDAVIKRFDSVSKQGATFIDAEGKKDGIIWFLEATIRDGANKTAGKRLIAVYQEPGEKAQQLTFLNPSVIWDLKPVGNDGEPQAGSNQSIDFDLDNIISFVIKEDLEKYKNELLKSRRHDAHLKEKYGIRSLETLILDSDAKISDYETRRMKGENIPEATIHNEMRKREDLERKKTRLLDEVKAEVSLYPTEPKIIGAIRVIPGANESRLVYNKETEQIGMDKTIEYEKSQGRLPEDVHKQDLGYDIRSEDKAGNYRYIEVKAWAGEGPVRLTKNEWLKAQRLGEEYWVYVILNAKINPELYLIWNPAAYFTPFEEIVDVRYVIKGWKENSQRV